MLNPSSEEGDWSFEVKIFWEVCFITIALNGVQENQ